MGKKNYVQNILVPYLSQNLEGCAIVTEYRFHPVRQWRFDIAILDHKIAIEIEGGVYIQGRHTRGRGFENDMTKYNEAVIYDWHLLRYSTGQAKKDPGKIVSDVRKLMKWE